MCKPMAKLGGRSGPVQCRVSLPEVDAIPECGGAGHGVRPQPPGRTKNKVSIAQGFGIGAPQGRGRGSAVKALLDGASPLHQVLSRCPPIR